MEIGDWITLGAVIVALGIGVASILHTRSMQKRERRERLLNEIIEWVENVVKCSIETGSEKILNATSLDYVYLYQLASVTNKIGSFALIKVRGFYINKMSHIFGNPIHDAIVDSMIILQEHIDLLSEHVNNFPNPPVEKEMEKKYDASSTNVYNHAHKLNESVKKVLEEAIKIKVADIS